MPLLLDARIPVRFGTLQTQVPEAAFLIEGDSPGPLKAPVVRFVLAPDGGHIAGCACCLPRGPAAEALGRLFLARARGEEPSFRLVIAVPISGRGKAAIRSALEQDRFVSARYRLEAHQ